MGAPALTAIAAIETAPTPHCAATAIALSIKLFSLNLANLTIPNRIPILFESVKSDALTCLIKPASLLHEEEQGYKLCTRMILPHRSCAMKSERFDRLLS